MTSLSPGGHRRKAISDKAPLIITSRRNKLHNVLPEKTSGLIRHPFVSTPLTPKLPIIPAMQSGSTGDFYANNKIILQPPKMLVNVTVENSPGAMQVVMLAEDTVGDLLKAALVLYEKEKRRPFLKDTDPKRYELHYSSFALQSLQADEKIMNLGSRNFFLCSNKARTSCCSEKENMAIIDSACPWMIFVHLLL